MVKKTAFLIQLVTGQTFRGYCTNRIPLTSREIIAKRNALFTGEKSRQAGLIPRVEKIRVKYEGNPKACTLVMNKGVSTPADCAKHLPEQIGKMAVLAYVDGQPWDMYSPLKGDCELTFAHFKEANVDRMLMINKVFWRSCSFLLGYAIERAFKDDYRVLLHSWPAPSIKSGSFVYDAVLPLENWKPTNRELVTIGHPIHKMYLDGKIFERLEVTLEVAQQIFAENRFKHEQVEEFAESDENHKVVLYRCGDHVDISRGPMMANSAFVRGFDVTSVHPFQTPIGLVHRFQGIAYPSQFTMSPFARNVLKERATAMNTIGLPEESSKPGEEVATELASETELDDDNEHSTKVHKAAQ